MERRRPLWLPALQPLLRPLYEAPAQDVFYLIDDEFSQQTCWHLPFLGHRLQHGADSGSREKLLSRPTRPRYVAWTRLADDTPDIALPGYVVLVRAPKGLLFEAQ